MVPKIHVYKTIVNNHRKVSFVCQQGSCSNWAYHMERVYIWAYHMERVYMFSLLEFLTTKHPSLPWGKEVQQILTKQQEWKGVNGRVMCGCGWEGNVWVWVGG